MKVYVVISNEKNAIGVFSNTTELFESIMSYFVDRDYTKSFIADFVCDWCEYDIDCLDKYNFSYTEMCVDDYFKEI